MKDVFSDAANYNEAFTEAHQFINQGLIESNAELVRKGYERLADVVGLENAQDTLFKLVSANMQTGKFSFVDEQTGEVSPLL